MAILARIQRKDEQVTDEPGARATLNKVRSMAAIAAARFELDHDVVALSDSVDAIVVACNRELVP